MDVEGQDSVTVPHTGVIREIPLNVADRFPRHGGVFIEGHYGLLFPVLSALRGARAYRQRLGAPDRRDEEVFPVAYIPFRESLQNLVVSLGMLRELEQGFPANYLSDRTPEKDLAATRAFERSPILLATTFHQLKLCGNRFSQGAGSLLFKKTGQDRKRFQDLASDVEDSAKLTRLGPLVDPSAAARLFVKHKSWFYAVADSPGKRGLRERAEHDLSVINAAFMVTSDSTGSTDGRLIASIGSYNDWVHDVRQQLQDACAGMCQFFEEFCKLVKHAGGYVYEDAIGFAGNGDDGVHFWPRI